MKPAKIFRFSGLLIALFVAGNAIAQQPEMKELPEITITGTNTTISDKVWSSFQSYFGKDVKGLRWYEIDRNYLAKFIKDDQEQQAAFTKKGHLIYHISYGSEKNLPDEIRRQVKSVYLDQKITTVFKVNRNEKTVWVVNLEDNKNLYLVRIEDGELEEVEKYKLAS